MNFIFLREIDLKNLLTSNKKKSFEKYYTFIFRFPRIFSFLQLNFLMGYFQIDPDWRWTSTTSMTRRPMKNVNKPVNKQLTYNK